MARREREQMSGFEASRDRAATVRSVIAKCSFAISLKSLNSGSASAASVRFSKSEPLASVDVSIAMRVKLRDFRYRKTTGWTSEIAGIPMNW